MSRKEVPCAGLVTAALAGRITNVQGATARRGLRHPGVPGLRDTQHLGGAAGGSVPSARRRDREGAAPALGALGAWLYRLQHSDTGAVVSAAEWRRVWQAYHARKVALAA